MLHPKLERTDTRNLCSDSQLLNAVPTQRQNVQISIMWVLKLFRQIAENIDLDVLLHLCCTIRNSIKKQVLWKQKTSFKLRKDSNFCFSNTEKFHTVVILFPEC